MNIAVYSALSASKSEGSSFEGEIERRLRDGEDETREGAGGVWLDKDKVGGDMEG